MISGFQGPRQKRIARQAADWHARMLEPASETEVQAFEAWLHADPGHAAAYAEAESLAALSARLPRRLLASPASTSRPARLRPAYGVAAAVILIISSALLLTGQGPDAAHAAITNSGPAVRGFKLSDGTTVILDSGSELAVAFERDGRTVTLNSGRARISVARDPRRPFFVKAAQATLRTGVGVAVVDVALTKDEVSIRVVDGLAFLITTSTGEEDRRAIRLNEGRAVNVRDGRLDEANVDATAARWPEARLSFDDTPLATIVELANRRGRPKIILADAGVGALRVTGVLDIRDTRSLARKLATTLDLQVEERSDELRLTR